MKRRNLSKALSLVLILCLCAAAGCAAAFAAGETDGKTVILYSANMRGDIGVLPQMAALKNAYVRQGAEVFMVDAGNYLQGTVYAAYDSGKTVVTLMDKAGYDVAAIGSHEFDFGTGQVGVEQHEVYYADDTLGKLLADASFSAVSANIFTDGTINAFAPSAKITTASGRVIGFFGITDPGTVNRVLESNLSGLTFQDGSDAAAAQVAALAGCDLIVGLANQGSLPDIPGAVLLDIGEEQGFTVGAMVINNVTGAVESNEAFVLADTERDETVKAAVDAAKLLIDEQYPAGSVIRSEVTLEGSMAASRSGETNTGNLWTDALLWFAVEGGIAAYYEEDEINNGNVGIAVDADHIVAVWNGGNLRDYLNTGDVTLKDIQRVLPYPNKVAVVYLTGAQLLEMLESATQGLPYNAGTSAACASFPQVAGIRYTVKTGIPYDAGEAYGNNWFTANSIRRVRIDSIHDKAFSEEATYAVITSNAIANGMDSNYICKEKDFELSTITTAAVTDVVWLYLRQKLGGVIGGAYASPQGRITIDNAVSFSDVPASSPYYGDVVYVTENGLMRGTDVSVFAPDAGITRADFVTLLYKLAGCPDADTQTLPFTDVAADAPYARAVAWALANGITAGTSETAFSPGAYMTRQQMAVFVYHYCGKPESSGELTYGDASEVAVWAQKEALFCTSNGYMRTAGAAFNPHAAASRADVASALARIHAR